MSLLSELFKPIADKIRFFLGVEDLIPPSQFNEKIEKVYEAGKQAEYDRFWEGQLDQGKRGNYSYAFCNQGWNDETFNPPIALNCIYVCSHMFYISNITDIKVDLNFKPVNSAQTSVSVFNGAKKLKTIRKLSVTDLVTFSSWFRNCTALENITIDGLIANDFDVSHSPLTKESILSIYEHASTAHTFTITYNLNAVNKAFETSEGANDGSTSEEWKTLIANKSSGLTISLV